MDDPKDIRAALAAAGKLQELVDKVLVYGVVPRWLPLSVACFYAGVGEKKMMEHIRAGRIYATQDDDGEKWLVDRLSIDNYRLRGQKELTDIVENVLAKYSTKR